MSAQGVALVTGASRGIGRATALALAAAGFDLVICARTVQEGQVHEHALTHADGRALKGSLTETAEMLKALGRQVLVTPMDLLDESSLRRAVKQALEHFGRVDVLVNNAIYQAEDLNCEFLSIGADTLQRVFQGYVLAPVLLTQLLLPGMIERGRGVVVNVTSGAGERNPPVPSYAGGWGYGYAAGKAAVSRLSGILSAEYGPKGIRAFTVNPGVVTTEALQATIGEQGILALQSGTAPPDVPAAVIRWLATSPDAIEHQRKTIQAQSFALEHAIVPDWRAPSGALG